MQEWKQLLLIFLLIYNKKKKTNRSRSNRFSFTRKVTKFIPLSHTDTSTHFHVLGAKLHAEKIVEHSQTQKTHTHSRPLLEKHCKQKVKQKWFIVFTQLRLI